MNNRIIEVFAQLQAAAAIGDRAPFNTDIDGGALTVKYLVIAGKIRVEVYGKNWRVIEILVGDFTSYRTQENPRGGKPYRVFDIRQQKLHELGATVMFNE